MKKRDIIICTSVIATMTVNSVTFASNQDKINSNNSKIESLREQSESLEIEKDSINDEILELIKDMEVKQSQIDDVQSRIDALQDEINELQESIDITTDEIFKTEEKILETEQSYKEKEEKQKYQEEVLTNRLKRNYMNNTYNEFLAIILDSDSLSEILFKFKYVNDIMQNDKNVIEELKRIKLELAMTKSLLDEEKESLETKKSSLEYQKDLIVQKQDIVEEEKEFLDSQMAELEAVENEKQSKINSIIKSQRYIQSQIEDLTSENNSLNNILQSPTAGGVYNATGRLIKPTTGTYTSKYGMRIHPITKKESFHTGQDIANNYGTRIVAADGGKVVQAKYNGAFGNAIIIDHGNGFKTMYAHLQSFSVGVGDIVSQGQKIGEMGSTGWSTGPHLHYEVWINGKHTNPMAYMN